MKVLIIGGSSWIGNELTEYLDNLGYEVFSTYYTTPFEKFDGVRWNIQDGPEKLPFDFSEFDCIINSLCIKENYHLTESLHHFLIQKSLLNDIYYVYLSSSNALDADVSNPHHENEIANASSEYGKHKQRCEEYLIKTWTKFSILRFPAIHGYSVSPDKRTVRLLNDLKEGNEIKIPRGVYQNRIYIGYLVEMIEKILSKQYEGVFHLGSSDQSEEYEFQRKIALGFGYSPSSIKSGEEKSRFLTVWPQRIIQLFGNEIVRTETQTIQQIIRDKRLKIYKRL